MNNFWTKLAKPILILAPMDDVTDTVFRQIVVSAARPTIFFTEFTNCDGLMSVAQEKLLPRLSFVPEERPIVAQIWGANPENYTKTARLLVKLGFDGIDINMGCPVHAIHKQGACGALIKNPELAAKIIAATKKGAGKLPVSVKTRIGFSQIETESWITHLLKQDIAALTVHGRTVKEMSKVPAHWGEIAKAVEIRNQLGVKTLIIGNGDVKSFAEAQTKASQYGLDGIMIGRGIFNNLWVFKDNYGDEYLPTQAERIDKMIEHLNLFINTYHGQKNYAIMKKFFKAYINNFDGAAELRAKLMETTSPEQVKNIINNI